VEIVVQVDGRVRGHVTVDVSAAAQEDETQLIRKVLRRIIPFCILCFLLNYVDRANIAIAKSSMIATCDSPTTICTPSAHLLHSVLLVRGAINLIQQRVGARRWIARISHLGYDLGLLHVHAGRGLLHPAGIAGAGRGRFFRACCCIFRTGYRIVIEQGRRRCFPVAGHRPGAGEHAAGPPGASRLLPSAGACAAVALLRGGCLPSSWA
jgi:hypothetical protein